MFIFKKEFSTIEELIAFNNSITNGAQTLPPVIPLGAQTSGKAGSKTGGKKPTVAAAPAAPSSFGAFPAANEMQQIPSPFNPGVVAQAQAPVQAYQAPVAPAYVPPIPAAPVHQAVSVNGHFNREGGIQEVRNLMASLEALNGFTQDHAASEIGNLYNQAQCQLGTPISQLDDASLQRFLPLFRARVAALTGSQVQQVPVQNFI